MTDPPQKKEWTWNEDQDGYEGVHLNEGQLVWFQHTHNPHAGGVAREQSFEDFLENGPACFIPGEFSEELCDAVKHIVSKKDE